MGQGCSCARTDSGTGNGDCIWVVGGVSSTPKKCSSMNSAEMLDYETWNKGNKTEGFQMMNPVKEGRYGGCGAFAAGSLWICGGYSGTKHLETMETFNFQDEDKKAWKDSPKMLGPRTFSGMAAYNDTLYVCGGMGRPRGSWFEQPAEVVETVDKFNAGSDAPKWEEAPSMKSARSNCAVIATNEGIVVIGGKARKGTTLDCVEFLDLANGATEWSTDKYPQLPSKRSTACAVYDPKGQTIYVFGGDDETGTILADGWKLDLNKQDDGWVAMPSMREPRTMFGMVIVGDCLCAVGGGNKDTKFLPWIDMLNFKEPNAVWNQGPTMFSVERQRPTVFAHPSPATLAANKPR